MFPSKIVKLGLHTFLVCSILFTLCVTILPIHAQVSPYQEAPMLAEQVKAGELPSVEKRLPSNPVVVQPEENVGTYGGTWHMAMVGDDRNFLIRTVGYEPLVRWDSEWTRVIPNVAQSYDINENATEYTFHLRQGTRWSDGEPFTADDIVFWYQAVFLNKDLTPAPASWLMVNNKPVVVEKKDDYTVTFRFAAPNGLFLQRLATPDALVILNYPRHYMAQFHTDYNPNIAELIEKAGVKTWVELFNKKVPLTNFALNWEAPSLNPWVLASDYFGGGSVVRAVRNPYYWKVDTEFNQLPYLDNVEFAVVKDRAALNDLAVRGQIDMQLRNTDATVADAQNMQKGKYHTIQGIPTTSTSLVIALNLNHADLVKRAIFQNHDFRVGLSYAINRAKTSALDPVQVAPVPESPLYNEQFAKQYTQYDVQKANEYLDKAGYQRRDADGFRLGPDDKRISFTVVVSNPVPNVTNPLPLVTQIQSDWGAVGIEMKIQSVPRQDAEGLFRANNFDATVWSGDGGFEAILEPRYYFPYSIWSLYALSWARWFANPEDPLAQEPPDATKQQMQLYSQLQATVDPDKQLQLMKQIIAISADQFYVIGLNRPPMTNGVVRDNFHNVPSTMPNSWAYPEPGPTNPCQYYIDSQS